VSARQGVGALEAIEIRSIAELVDRVRSITERRGGVHWFRGQSGSEHPLVPSAFRGRRLEDEVVMNARFRLHAPTRYAACPAADDLPRWLCLMQHFGLPTRLLDWTESPLAALFFGVSHVRGAKPAVVWMLSPGNLNRAIGVPNAVILGHAATRPLIEAAFLATEPSDRVVAVVGQDVDLRMSLQHSVFTLHGDATPLDERERSYEFLSKLVIPAASRRELARDLDMLGIRRSTLFPDIENLARELADSWRAEEP
jgi:hypothetical protein